ncbi:MAG: ketopantoate reductase family protein [Pseudoramibacter sp.]
MKYLVIGAGGTGGMIAFKLAQGKKDVTVIARGDHLKAIREDGLKVHTKWDGKIASAPVKAVTADACGGPYDVIFVCFKWYSIEDALLILEKAADAKTVIIPILNIYGTGEKLQAKLPDLYILDGCIYVASKKEKAGQILQFGKIMRIVFGPRKGQEKRPVLSDIARDLDACGIEGRLSDSIEQEALEKFCYVSPVGAAGLYFGATSADFVRPGEKRDFLTEMMKEVVAIGKAMGVEMDGEAVINRNLDIVATLDPKSTTSMQRDVMAGQHSEMDGLVLEVLRLAKRYGVDVPAYRKAAEAFRKRGWFKI